MPGTSIGMTNIDLMVLAMRLRRTKNSSSAVRSGQNIALITEKAVMIA